jgi:hypothetical protein
MNTFNPASDPQWTDEQQQFFWSAFPVVMTLRIQESFPQREPILVRSTKDEKRNVFMSLFRITILRNPIVLSLSPSVSSTSTVPNCQGRSVETNLAHIVFSKRNEHLCSNRNLFPNPEDFSPVESFFRNLLIQNDDDMWKYVLTLMSASLQTPLLEKQNELVNGVRKKIKSSSFSSHEDLKNAMNTDIENNDIMYLFAPNHASEQILMMSTGLIISKTQPGDLKYTLIEDEYTKKLLKEVPSENESPQQQEPVEQQQTTQVVEPTFSVSSAQDTDLPMSQPSRQPISINRTVIAAVAVTLTLAAVPFINLWTSWNSA